MRFHVHIELMLQFVSFQIFTLIFWVTVRLEVNALKKITSEITKPITCIIGGSKISTKINVIKNLIPKFDYIVIVGGMANNFIEYLWKQYWKIY